MDGSEAFIFAPISEDKTLSVLDPTRSLVEYTKGSRFGYGYMDLFDCEGRLVCSPQVTTNKNLLWEYISTFHGSGGSKEYEKKKVKVDGDL